MDDIDAALESHNAVSTITARDFIADMERLEPLVEALVAGFAKGRVIMDRPEQRQALAELHARLDSIIGYLAGGRRMIEAVFLQAAVDKHAEAIPLPDGSQVVYEAPRGEYVTDGKALRAALLAIAELDGDVRREEIEDALPEEVVVKPDHRRLNALAKKRGDAVREAIARHRTFVTPPPERGRVRFPR